MTREETQNLLAMMQAAYQNYNPPSKTAAVNVWHMMLQDFDWKLVQAAFVAFVRENSSGFPPSPGQIIEKIQLLTKPEDLNEMEAWALVSKAIRRSAYNSREEYEKLPESVQKAVGSSNQLYAWAMDTEYNESVVSSHFVRCYWTIVERENTIAKMPENIRKLIGQVNQKLDGIESNAYSIEEK